MLGHTEEGHAWFLTCFMPKPVMMNGPRGESFNV